MRKYGLTFLALLLSVGMLSANASAQKVSIQNELDETETIEYEEAYRSLIKITNGKGNSKDYNKIVSEGDTGIAVLSSDEIGLLYDEKNAISFDVDWSLLKTEHRTSPNFHLYAIVEMWTSAFDYYECQVDLTDNQLLSSGDLFALAGVPTDEKINAVSVMQKNSRDEEFIKNQPLDYKMVIWGYEPLITGVRVIDTSKKGWINITKSQWNKEPPFTELFYVNSSRQVYTGLKSINGIRYRFDNNGICQGKYTGFAVNANGKMYFRKGLLVKDSTFEINGKSYRSDKNGYVKSIE